ncbi:MAG: glycosyltransferase [Bacteroidales bacterium]|nr:glycosyltransferase [Bacteroidales bacterium]
MNILVCLSRFPYPLNKGDKLRAFHQIKELSLNHDIYLFCLSNKYPKQEDILILKRYCKEIHVERLNIFLQCFYLFLSFFSSLPFQVAWFSNGKAKKHFLQFFNKHHIDVSYFQFVRTMEYAKKITGKKVLDFQDCLSVNMQRRAEKSNFFLKNLLLLEAKKLRNYENKAFDVFSSTTIITKTDRDLISSCRNKEIHIIENGVSEEYFAFPKREEKKYDIIFSGNMSYAPNIDAALYLVKEIMPKVWEKFSNCKVVIAGSNPSKEVLKLESENVEITGWVDDMKEYYALSKIFIAPMRIGTGLQNKLLEAMAMSLPCITTPLANNALKSQPNRDILVNDSAKDLSDSIINLLEDTELYKRISNNGCEFVKQNYNWNASAKKLEKILYE